MVDGVVREVYSDCQEQRWSAFIQAMLMFAALPSLVLVSWIPIGCLHGIFLYFGVTRLYTNEIMGRLLSFLICDQVRPPSNVSRKANHLFTWIQAICGTTIFAVGNFAPIGTCYTTMEIVIYIKSLETTHFYYYCNLRLYKCDCDGR